MGIPILELESNSNSGTELEFKVHFQFNSESISDNRTLNTTYKQNKLRVCVASRTRLWECSAWCHHFHKFRFLLFTC